MLPGQVPAGVAGTEMVSRVERPERAGGGEPKDDWIGGDVTHGAIGDLLVGWIRGDVEKQIRGTNDRDIFVALRMRRGGMIGGGF